MKLLGLIACICVVYFVDRIDSLVIGSRVLVAPVAIVPRRVVQPVVVQPVVVQPVVVPVAVRVGPLGRPLIGKRETSDESQNVTTEAISSDTDSEEIEHNDSSVLSSNHIELPTTEITGESVGDSNTDLSDSNVPTSEATTEFDNSTNVSSFQNATTSANCTITNNSLNCIGDEPEHNFVCEVVPKLAHLQNMTLEMANLIIKPELIENVESLKLLMKVPVERFSIVNATVKAYTFISHHKFNNTKETLSVYSNQNLTSPGFLVKDHKCFSQLALMAKNILIEQFRIFVYLNHMSTFF